MSLVGQPPPGDVPAREVLLAPGDLNRHLPVVVVLPQVQAAGPPGPVVIEPVDVLALHASLLLVVASCSCCSSQPGSCGRTRTLPVPGAWSRMVATASPTASSG